MPPIDSDTPDPDVGDSKESASPNETRSFTGRTKQHSTRRSVKLADTVSQVVITVGGIGTIIAVSLVFVLLLSVVVPMFRSAELTKIDSADVGSTAQLASSEPLQTGVDEYQVLAWSLFADGRLDLHRLDTGERICERRLLDDGITITAVSYVNNDQHLVFARSDGKLQFGVIGFQTEYLSDDKLPPDLSASELVPEQLFTLGEAVVEVTPQLQLRSQTLEVKLQDAVAAGEGVYRLLDHTITTRGPVLAGVTEDNKLRRIVLRERRNVLTGQTTVSAKATEMPLELRAGRGPDFVMIPSRGDGIFAIWKDGHLARFLANPPAGTDASNAGPLLAETVDLLAGAEAEVDNVGWVLGRETMLVADSSGRCLGWFLVRQSEAETPDGAWLLPVHELSTGMSKVTDIAASQRSRMVGIGYEDGQVQVFQVTTEVDMLTATLVKDGPVLNLMFGPKDDGLVAVSNGRIHHADLDPAYPEATVKSLFGKVWYEGYEKPEHVWQSSFAGVKAEMKLGLMPLVFGTLKATVYSMMFGVPIALLAAVYTSEFLSPKARNPIKSLIEMMASLPSVVLGFIGGLVIAPVVEQFVPSVVASFITIPTCWLLGAYLWQQLPHERGLLLAPYRLWFILAALAVGFCAAWKLGPFTEAVLFAGDMSQWLDQQRGTGVGAWLFLLLPFCALATAAVITLFVNPWLAEKNSSVARSKFALVNLIKFFLGVLFAFALAYLLANVLTMVWDPRGGYVGTYVQRNALVVGFVMGFAIIPIIYTISEDSLSTVPKHLRSASLGAGATQLQTAIRIVIPTAMSGLFSAIMIGLGRAVGETMIVLMAAGNTALIDWNVFNGFRTLSANIAVELPEAVRDSTHYRTLFLAALTLLVLTFVINTVAEMVRLRFRKRAVQL